MFHESREDVSVYETTNSQNVTISGVIPKILIIGKSSEFDTWHLYAFPPNFPSKTPSFVYVSINYSLLYRSL